MGNAKRLVSLITALVLVFGCASVGFSVDVDALEIQYASSQTQNRSYLFSTDFVLTGNYADDVIAVAKAQLGKTTTQLDYSEAWCANFQNDTARLTGMPDTYVPYNYGLRASCGFMYRYMLDYCNAHVVEDVNDVRTGDYVFYYCPASNFFLHIGVVENPNFYLEGNYNNMVREMPFNYNYSCYKHIGYGYTTDMGHVKRIYVRPDYPEPPKKDYSDKDPDHYKDYIPSRTLTYKEPVLTSGYDVCWTQGVLCKIGYLNDVTGEYNKKTLEAVKKFQKDKNLSVSGEVDASTVEALIQALDDLNNPSCTNFTLSSSTYDLNQNIKITGEFSNTDTFRMIIRDSQKNVVKNYYMMNVCEFPASDLGEGTYKAYFKMHNSHATINTPVVTFTVEKPVPEKPRLAVESGTSFKAVKFTWDDAVNSSSYQLHILDAKDNSKYITRKYLTGNEYSILLPKGSYTAYLTADNEYFSTVGDKINVTVSGGSPADIGDKVYARFILGDQNLSLCDNGGYAAVTKVPGDFAKTWYLEKVNSSYKLKNCESFKYLSYDGHSLKLEDGNKSSSQRWYLAQGSSGYYLVPFSNPNSVVYFSQNGQPIPTVSVRKAKDASEEDFTFNQTSPVHNYEMSDITAPTCTENGHVHYHCDICGEDFDRILAPEGHRYVSEKAGAGHYIYTCVYCGDSYEVGGEDSKQNSQPNTSEQTAAVDTPDTPDTPDEPDANNNTEEIPTEKIIEVPKTIKTYTEMMGDVDGDGDVTVYDSLLINRVSVGIEQLTEVGKVIADVDCDGKVTSADALYVLREVVKIYTDTKTGDVINVHTELDGGIHLIKNDDND